MSVEPRALRTEAEEKILSGFEAVKTSLAGSAAVKTRREAAMGEFRRLGLPHRRIEAWKYTDLRGLTKKLAPLAGASDEAVLKRLLAENPFASLDRIRLIVADGRFRADLSDLSPVGGVAIRSLAEALTDSDQTIGALFADNLDPTLALNTAFAGDGVMIALGPGVSLEKPIEIVHVASNGVFAASRNVVTLGAGAKCRLIESHFGPAGTLYQSNVVTEVSLGAGAILKMARLDRSGDAASLIASLIVTLAAKAEFDHAALAAGGALSRAHSFVKINGAGARLGMFGATLLGGKRHGDTKLTIEHASAGSNSRVLFKNVVDGSATGAFQGMIVVAPDSQKTDGRMLTRTLLLSEGASFAQKPELEIYADDVQCGHGATSGRLDQDMLFYLLARGIPRHEAERLLLRAFLTEAMDGLGEEELSAPLAGVIESWLGARQ